jgi:hypothetical protein
VNWDRPQYLLYQTVHGRPLTAGYTSRRNPSAPVEQYPGLQHLRALGQDVLPFPDAATFATISADLGLAYVVLDYYQMPGGDERETTVQMAERLLAGQSEVYHDDRLVVYRMAAPVERRPYLRLVGAWGELEGQEVARRPCSECGLELMAVAGSEVGLTAVCQDGEHRSEVGPGIVALAEVAPGCALARRLELSAN